MPYVPISPTVNGGNVVAGQNLAVGSAALSLSTLNSATNLVVVQVQNNDVYATFDGTVPSATNGARLFANESYHWDMDTARRASFIQVSSSARVYAQEFTTSLEKTGMPDTGVVKPPTLGAYGFFVNPMTAIGDLIYGGAAGIPTRGAANTTATKKFWTETGTGSAGQAPGWNTISSGDLPAGTGTVTSIGTTAPITGGPITTSGTIAVSTATTSAVGVVKPDNTSISITAGTLSITVPVTVPNGGTGQINVPTGQILYGNASAALSSSSSFTTDGSGGTSQAGNETFTTAGTGVVGSVAGTGPNVAIVGYSSGVGLSSTSAITLTSGVVVDVVSHTFPAGNFLVWGNVWFLAAAGTITNPCVGGISTTSATLPGINSAAETQSSAQISSGGFEGTLPIVPKVFRSSIGFTLYLVSAANFTVSTLTTFGGMTWLQLP